MTDIATVFSRHQALYDEMAKSHPSLLRGKVWCGRCGTARTVDPAACLRNGWPKCCGGTMSIAPAEAKT